MYTNLQKVYVFTTRDSRLNNKKRYERSLIELNNKRLLHRYVFLESVAILILIDECK